MVLQKVGDLERKRLLCLVLPSLSLSIQASFKGETTVLGRQPFQSLPFCLRSLTGILITGHFPGGFCDVGICPLRNGLEPQIHLK